MCKKRGVEESHFWNFIVALKERDDIYLFSSNISTSSVLKELSTRDRRGFCDLGRVLFTRKRFRLLEVRMLPYSLYWRCIGPQSAGQNDWAVRKGSNYFRMNRFSNRQKNSQKGSLDSSKTMRSRNSDKLLGPQPLLFSLSRT